MTRNNLRTIHQHCARLLCLPEPACENKLSNYIQTVSHSGQPRRVKNTSILEVPRSTKSQAYQLLPQNLPKTIASLLYIPGQQPANTRTKSRSILPSPIIRSLLPFGSHQCNMNLSLSMVASHKL